MLFSLLLFESKHSSNSSATNKSFWHYQNKTNLAMAKLLTPLLIVCFSMSVSQLHADNDSLIEGTIGHSGWQKCSCPRGLQGAQGLQGQTGLKGDTGAKGAIGPKGDSGVDGDKGPDGMDGTTGSKGDPGEKGPVGEKGEDGGDGENGMKWPKGTAGMKGDKGDKGETGLAGQTGKNGPDGDQGPMGSKGSPGSKGAPGKTGPTGDTGANGLAGMEGDPGFKGKDGTAFTAAGKCLTYKTDTGTIGAGKIGTFFFKHGCGNQDMVSCSCQTTTSDSGDILALAGKFFNQSPTENDCFCFFRQFGLKALLGSVTITTSVTCLESC